MPVRILLVLVVAYSLSSRLTLGVSSTATCTSLRFPERRPWENSYRHQPSSSICARRMCCEVSARSEDDNAEPQLILNSLEMLLRGFTTVRDTGAVYRVLTSLQSDTHLRWCEQIASECHLRRPHRRPTAFPMWQSPLTDRSVVPFLPVLYGTLTSQSRIRRAR